MRISLGMYDMTSQGRAKWFCFSRNHLAINCYQGNIPITGYINYIFYIFLLAQGTVLQVKVVKIDFHFYALWNRNRVVTIHVACVVVRISWTS